MKSKGAFRKALWFAAGGALLCFVYFVRREASRSREDESTSKSTSVAIEKSKLELTPKRPLSSSNGVSQAPEFTDEAALREASRLNAMDKPGALQLILDAEDRFPESPYAEPRRALRITLLIDLGRMEEARALVRPFLERYPKSEYGPLVQGVTGIHPRPFGPKNASPGAVGAGAR